MVGIDPHHYEIARAPIQGPRDKARAIDLLEGKSVKLTAIATRPDSLFPGCLTHDIEITAGGMVDKMVIHSRPDQGQPPTLGAGGKRKRMGRFGFALLWADADGLVNGGGFTTGAIPADWRT